MTSRRDAAFAAVDDVMRDPAPTSARSLDALAGLPILRAHLDDLEAAAIDTARRAGASWDDIARALGLRSRQAAEQRRLRLGGPSADLSAVRVTRRQQKIDNSGGTAISVLRATSQRLALRLDYEAAVPAVRLARDTLRLARDVEPGALIDLLRLALDDLGGAAVEPDVATLVARLRQELLSITDSTTA